MFDTDELEAFKTNIELRARHPLSYPAARLKEPSVA